MSSPSSSHDAAPAQILYKAVQDNTTKEALELIERASNVETDYVDHTSRWTALHWAAYHGNEKIVQALVHNAAVNKKRRVNHGGQDIDSNLHRPVAGGTPLHRASQRGHLSICWLLLLSTFSIDDVDNIGNSALHLAAAYGCERVVSLYTDFGANVFHRNNFCMTPLDLCTDSKCREILTDAMASRVGVSSLPERDILHRNQTEKYMSKERTIVDIVGGKRDEQDIAELKRLLDDGREFGLPLYLVELGTRRVKWLEVENEISCGIHGVQESSPVTTPTQYNAVNTLKTLLKKIETAMQDDDKNHPTKLVQTIMEARRTCEVANAEFSLSKAIKSANEMNETRTMTLLKEAKLEAANLGGDSALVGEASDLLAKLLSEQELQAAVDRLPSVRLPVPDMTPKEAKSYWQAEDIGHIEQHKEFPLLPEGVDEYEWVPSKSLEDFRSAMLRLEHAINEASNCAANSDLVQTSQELYEKKTGERTLLEEKDAEDRIRAIAEAKKAAKKLKKKKKKKKSKATTK